MDWRERYGGERYYSLNYYLKKRFGEKVYKLALDGGMTCPNRDGTLENRGCIFCSAGGSGDFAVKGKSVETDDFAVKGKSVRIGGFTAVPEGMVTAQIEEAKLRIRQKTNAGKFIAYFQSYTNTYAPVEYLRQIFTEAIDNPEVVVLSIGTRPDCLGEDVVDLLSELNQIKPVWVELGLQTIHEKTAKMIRRGYGLPVFEDAVRRLKAAGLEVIVHVILGLPGETKADMLNTVRYLAGAGIDGIKLQLLHVLTGTDLMDLYEQGTFQTLTLDEYMDILFDCMELLPPDMVLHRITGDGPKKLLAAPVWSGDKKMVLNTIRREMKNRDIVQGASFDTQNRKMFQNF